MCLDQEVQIDIQMLLHIHIVITNAQCINLMISTFSLKYLETAVPFKNDIRGVYPYGQFKEFRILKDEDW